MYSYNSSKFRIMIVVGGRHDYMKAGLLVDAFGRFEDFIDAALIHSGPAFDSASAEMFHKTLGLPRPDNFLDITGKSFSELTGKVISGVDGIINERHPDLLVVIGDSNTALASALAAAKAGIAIAHVDSGLRSDDKRSSKEVNRLLIDRISDFHFTGETNSFHNLRSEGVDENNIFFVGNLMADLFMIHMQLAQNLPILNKLNLIQGQYSLAALHHPSNLNEIRRLEQIVLALNTISIKSPVIFACDQKTAAKIDNLNITKDSDGCNIKIIDQLMYLDFLKLESEAAMVLTDSSGIQEETTLLNVPCITLLTSTERQATINEGTNVLAGPYAEKIIAAADSIMQGNKKSGNIPKYWDGKAATRIMEILMKIREALLRPGPAKLGTTKLRIIDAKTP